VGIPKVESVVDDLGNSVGGKLDLNPDPIKANYGVGSKEGNYVVYQGLNAAGEVKYVGLTGGKLPSGLENT